MWRAWHILFLLCAGLSVQAQVVIVPRQTLDAVNSPALSAQSTDLVFDETLLTPETLSEDGGIREFSYGFENVGRDTITIGKIVTTCTCARAMCPDKVILPGQRSEIIVTYNPKGHPGRFERKIFVYADGDDAPISALRLAVEVERGADKTGLYPIGMGNIRVRRNSVDFIKGTKAVETCAFINVSDKTLILDCDAFLLPSCLTFRTEPQVVSPGEEGRLVISYDPSKGGEKQNMPVVIKGLGVPPTQAAISVNMKEK